MVKIAVIVLCCIMFCQLYVSLVAQETTVILHVGSFSIPYSHKISVMEGDILALYDYETTEQTITLKRGAVLSDGTIEPQVDLIIYVVNPNWGTLTQMPLVFEYKNGKLYSAFKTINRVIVFFSNAGHTDVHVLDTSGMNIYGDYHSNNKSFYLVNEDLGYVSQSQLNPFLGRVYKMNFTTDTLELFYEIDWYADFGFLSFDDEYILMYKADTDTPDLLVQNDTIIQIIEGGWGDAPAGYYNTTRLCGDYYNTIELSILDLWETSLIAWVEDNELQRMLLGYGEYPYEPLSFRSVVSRNESSFSCITRGLTVNTFRNYSLTNGQLTPIYCFPDLSPYSNPRSLIAMGNDYWVAVSAPDDNVCSFTLVDFTDASIRNFQFDFPSTGFEVLASEEFLFLKSQNSVRILHLTQDSSVEDDVSPIHTLDIHAYPNPFVNQCSFLIRSPDDYLSKIDIYNIKGQKISELYTGYLENGEYSFTWDGRDSHQNPVSRGVYVIKAEAREAHVVKKIVKK